MDRLNFSRINLLRAGKNRIIKSAREGILTNCSLMGIVCADPIRPCKSCYLYTDGKCLDDCVEKMLRCLK